MLQGMDVSFSGILTYIEKVRVRVLIMEYFAIQYWFQSILTNMFVHTTGSTKFVNCGSCDSCRFVLLFAGNNIRHVGGDYRTCYGSHRYSTLTTYCLVQRVFHAIVLYQFSCLFFKMHACIRIHVYSGSNTCLIVGGVGCNLRLQRMMEDMVTDRGGSLCAMDHRYSLCVSVACVLYMGVTVQGE